MIELVPVALGSALLGLLAGMRLVARRLRDVAADAWHAGRREGWRWRW